MIPSVSPRSKRRIAVAGAAVGLALAGAAPAGAASDPQAAASEAIATGDGVAAAKIIRDEGFNTEPTVLADIIYGAGVIAVDRDTPDAFTDALPTAYLRGGVSLGTANSSFSYAAITVVGRSVNLDTTPSGKLTLAEQGKAGAVAIAKTESAYLGLDLRSTGRAEQ